VFTKLSQQASVAEWTAFGGTSPKAREQHMHLPHKARHNDGRHRDSICLCGPVEEEDWPLNPQLDEDPNGCQTIVPEPPKPFQGIHGLTCLNSSS